MKLENDPYIDELNKLITEACPQCGSNNISVAGDDFDADCGCDDCSFTTFHCFGCKAAIGVWNKRIKIEYWHYINI